MLEIDTSNLLILGETTSIQESIYLLDKNDIRYAIIIDKENIFKGYIDINELRRLLISGIDKSESFKNLSLRKRVNILDSSTNLIYDQIDDDDFPFIIFVNDLGRIVKVLYKNVLQKDVNKLVTGSSKRTVLVIGGAGYLGSVLTLKLLENQYKVRILDSFIYGKKSIESFCKNPDVEIITGDIRNIEIVVNAIENVDYVILLAAVVGDPASQFRPSQTIQTNYLATQAVAAACKLEQINRFIYASTCSVYGAGDDILNENSPLNPVSLYARTKIASEKSIMSLLDENFSPTILRMATLFGYSPRMRFDLVVNTMTLKAFQNNLITVFGGDQWRPLLHINDAANAFLKVIQANIQDVKGKIFNVGSEVQNYQIKDLAQVISHHLDNIPVQIEKASIDSRNYQVSFEKIKHELDFHIENEIIDGVEEIHKRLKNGDILNPNSKIYYNHFFDSTEEK